MFFDFTVGFSLAHSLYVDLGDALCKIRGLGRRISELWCILCYYSVLPC